MRCKLSYVKFWKERIFPAYRNYSFIIGTTVSFGFHEGRGDSNDGLNTKRRVTASSFYAALGNLSTQMNITPVAKYVAGKHAELDI